MQENLKRKKFRCGEHVFRKDLVVSERVLENLNDSGSNPTKQLRLEKSLIFSTELTQHLLRCVLAYLLTWVCHTFKRSVPDYSGFGVIIVCHIQNLLRSRAVTTVDILCCRSEIEKWPSWRTQEDLKKIANSWIDACHNLKIEILSKV